MLVQRPVMEEKILNKPKEAMRNAVPPSEEVVGSPSTVIVPQDPVRKPAEPVVDPEQRIKFFWQ